MVLEKTLESPLDCKEIQPVHAQDQSWVFIGRTDVEAETPILGHLMRTADSFEKTLILGKIEGRRRRGQKRTRWLDGIIDSYLSSVQFSLSVMSNSLRPHESQHTRPPCPSPTPGACSNLCPSSQRRHPTLLSSVVPFSSRLQSFPASGSFQISQLFALCG